MASISTLVDRVKITVLSTGTGAFQLGAAVRAYRGTEALLDGATYSYAVESGAQYEAGTGLYVASTSTLVRTPQISSNGGALVSFPANVELNFTALAADIVATGATLPIVQESGSDPTVVMSQKATTDATNAATSAAAPKAEAQALGVAPDDLSMGTFTGTIIPDDQTAKQGMQALETATESKLPIADPVSNGISRNKAGSWPEPENSVSMNATFTNGSANITVTNGAVVNNGDTIRGAPTQLPYQTYVVSGGGTNNLVLSRPASAAGTVPVTFGMDRWDLTSTTVGDTAGYRRLYIGAAAQGRSTLMAKINGQGLDYEQVTAFSAENELGAVGGWFGSRMSLENTGLAGLISLGTYCLIDEDPVSRHAWNGYDQSNLLAGTAPTGTAQFIQKEASLESYWPVVDIDPYNYNPAGSTRIRRWDSGIGDYVVRGDPIPNSISAIADIVNNGAAARQGFVFGNGSLDETGGRQPNAIAMPKNYAFAWYSALGNNSYTIVSKATTGNDYLLHVQGLLTSGSADFAITKAAGNSRSVYWQTNASNRWSVGATATAEAGSNAGSDFAIARYNDAGVYQALPFSIRRSNGRISMGDLQASTTYANDAAAASGGVAVGELYRNGSVIQIRIS